MKTFEEIGRGDLVEDWNGVVCEVLDTGEYGELCKEYSESPDCEEDDEQYGWPAVYAEDTENGQRSVMVYGEEYGGCTYHEGEKTYKLEVEVTIPGDLDIDDVIKKIERQFSEYSADVTDWEES